MKVPYLLAGVLLLSTTLFAHASQQAISGGEEVPGKMVFISDLHIGLGRDSNGEWHQKEDFRWPGALSGFLETISNGNGDSIDLVIVGDFLELWQLPDDIRCEGPGPAKKPELGCTVGELTELTGRVVAAHSETMKILRSFAQQRNNRLHIIPGNHDSALLIPEVWKLVFNALGGDSKQVRLVDSDVWSSADGRVIVEHGHQIGSDVNKYDGWPKEITKNINGKSYLVRPWGELFVQRLFNSEEREYPIIDNLSPETAGARYRMADRGLWDSIGDVAKFISFNLWETSLSQKGKFLGRQNDEDERPIWNLGVARKLGYKLIPGALSEEDPFRNALLDDSEESKQLKAELDVMIRDEQQFKDDDLRLLCDLVAISAENRDVATCDDPVLGYSISKVLVPREWVMRSHLRDRLKEHRKMQIFIYGHTHKYEKKWPLKINSMRTVDVLNTGAFQRLVDEKTFLKIAKDMSPDQALRELTVDDLPPCYTAVIIDYENGLPNPELMKWYMPEGGKGRFLRQGEQQCN